MRTLRILLSLFVITCSIMFATVCGVHGQTTVIKSDKIKVPVKGAAADGVTDDTAAILAAETKAKAIGGEVYLTAGTYLHTGLPIDSGVCYGGDGIGATTLKLAANANSPSIYGTAMGYGAVRTNPWSTVAGAQTGVVAPCVHDLTIDGNQVNQSGAGPYFGIDIYGYGVNLYNLLVTNTKGDCIRLDYFYSLPYYAYPPQDRGARENTVITSNCGAYYSGSTQVLNSVGAVGLRLGGPTDSQIANVISFHNAAENFHQGPHAGGTQWLNAHGWGTPNNTAYPIPSALIESNCQMNNFEQEGAASSLLGFVPQIVLLSNGCSGGAYVYAPQASAAGYTPVGVQFGALANTYGIIGSYFANSGQAGSATIVAPTSTSTGSSALAGNRNFLEVYGSGLSGGVINFFGATAENNNLITAYADNNGTSATLSGASWNLGSNTVTLPAGLTAAVNTTITGTGIPANAVVSSNNGNSNVLTISGTPTTQASTGAVLGNVLFQGTPASTDDFRIRGFGSGCAATTQPQTCGNQSSIAFTSASITNPHGGQVMSSGTFDFTSNSAETIGATGATITIFAGANTYGVIPVNPSAGAATGVILQAGNQNGETLFVYNTNATNSITFAAQATSHVQDGTSDVIAPLHAALFMYDGSNWWRIYNN